ncbi:MAG: glycogen/starch synthase, partial [Candidatus Marinimicrobia bacterium]|nr:glycogen/starch synthase [Candidatus Neomarinimicrobiota bacterium]
MDILFVSAEVTPFSKTGGLADVAGSLPAALSSQVASIRVITPLYGQIDQKQHSINSTGISGSVSLGSETLAYTVHKSVATKGQAETWFIGNERFFKRDGIYTLPNGAGFADNNQRFFFFQLVIIDLLDKQLLTPDILHCNDHHSGLLPGLVKGSARSIKTIFTIHNFLY